MGIRSLARRVAARVLRDDPPPAPRRVHPGPPPAPEPASTIECGAQELFERIEAGETVVLVDVRSDHEQRSGIIPGSILMPLSELQARWEELSAADEVVCYCAVGARSIQAAHFLRERGIFNATSMEGGLVAWRDVGGSVVAPV